MMYHSNQVRSNDKQSILRVGSISFLEDLRPIRHYKCIQIGCTLHATYSRPKKTYHKQTDGTMVVLEYDDR